VKRLILLRHAKSSWDDDALDDRERPLSARGTRDAPMMGARLRARETPPALILTSDAKRARKTAKAVADAWGCAHGAVRIDARLYLATPAQLLDVLAEQDGTLPKLLLVGHNPGLTELANGLLPSFRLANLPTAGVVAIAFAVDAWSGLQSAPADLAYYDYPKNPAAVD
jgi:phosphohistidine phosphatase